MKLKIDDLILENITMVVTEKELQIKCDFDSEVNMLQNITNAVAIDILDDEDNALVSVSDKFVNPRIIVDNLGKTISFFKVIDSPEDIMTKLDNQTKIVSKVFVQMAQDSTLDDITISEHPELFSEWTEKWTGKAGTILRDGDKLYRSLHDVTTTAQNTRPSETPSMWSLVADPDEEYPEWVQPLGSHDAYAMGDKSSHNSKNWVSTVDNNVWEPGVYGWEEVA